MKSHQNIDLGVAPVTLPVTAGPALSDGRGGSEVFMRQWGRWWLVVIYATAMAWVESAVVFYLRTMIDRINPHQADPFPLVDRFGWVELVREFSTMVMLLAVGFLAGGNRRARLGYFVLGFGVWDIAYYAFLKLMCGWPHSWLDWDVLFLLPVPWWGPVLAPIMIALLMIFWGTLASQFELRTGTRLSNWRIWTLNFAGMALALYVFMADTLLAAPRGLQAVCNILPEKFNWPLFAMAWVLMAAPVLARAFAFAPLLGGGGRNIARKF